MRCPRTHPRPASRAPAAGSLPSPPVPRRALRRVLSRRLRRVLSRRPPPACVRPARATADRRRGRFPPARRASVPRAPAPGRSRRKTPARSAQRGFPSPSSPVTRRSSARTGTGHSPAGGSSRLPDAGGRSVALAGGTTTHSSGKPHASYTRSFPGRTSVVWSTSSTTSGKSFSPMIRDFTGARRASGAGRASRPPPSPVGAGRRRPAPAG